MVVLEQYEWSDFWWEEADKNGKRVLLIGDSQTRGLRQFCKNALGEIYVDMLATSKCVDNPDFMREVKYIVEGNAYDVVCFSHGLHGWHLDDDGYRKACSEAFQYLKCKIGKVIVENCLPVALPGGGFVEDCERNPIVLRRNDILKNLAAENGVEFIDLYSVAYGKPEIRVDDGMHYNDEGYALLGGLLAEKILENI